MDRKWIYINMDVYKHEQLDSQMGKDVQLERLIDVHINIRINNDQ